MTSRRDFLAKLTLAAGAVSFLKPLNIFTGTGSTNSSLFPQPKLAILHTANLRGQINKLCPDQHFSGLGGLENISKEIEKIRNEKCPVLLIDSGNMWGNIQNEDHLHFCNELTRLKYDAIMPDKGDVENGESSLKELAKQSNLPYQIVHKSNFKIGLIHVKSHYLNRSSDDFIALLNQTALKLKEVDRCVLVIAMADAGLRKCRQLAVQTVAVDVFTTSEENNTIHNTIIERNKNNNEVILSAAGSKGVMISRIDITINNRNEKMNVSSKAVFSGVGENGYAFFARKYPLYGI